LQLSNKIMNDKKQANKDGIRQRYLAVDTSNVADVLDTLGYLNQGLSSDFAPLPVRRDGTRLAGWAYTICGQMTPFPLGGDDDKMQACQGLSAGEISVWSGDGRGICYFGELIARGMKERVELDHVRNNFCASEKRHGHDE
jgi:hypothetical protein